MSIQEHLNKIRNAIYGREVRESIAKGIETAYDDASEKDNANMEVKIARGTHPNLRSRLEEVDNKQQQTTAQLAQKASQSSLEVEKKRIDEFVTLEEGSTTGDAELIDGRIGISGKAYKNIGSAIRDQSKRVQKLLFEEDIHEVPPFEVGSYDTTDGREIDAHLNRARAGIFYTDKSFKIVAQGDYQFFVALYDGPTTDTFVETRGIWSTEHTVRAGQFLGIVVRATDNRNLENEIDLIASSIKTTPTDKISKLNNEIDMTNKRVSSIFGEVENPLFVTGLISTDDGRYIESPSPTRARTDLFEVFEGTKITASVGYEFYIGLYDSESNESFIGVSKIWLSEYVVPHDCYIVIVARAEDNRDISNELVSVSDNVEMGYAYNLKDIYNTIEQPKKQSDYTNNLIQVFPKYTTIGDSLTAGYTSIPGQDNIGSAVAVETKNNWPGFLELRTGREFNNIAVGGSTTKNWRDTHLVTAETETDAYIVALGVNDARQGLTVGASDDIKTDRTLNANTFYGNYDYLVRELKEYNLNAHVFLFTIPPHESNAETYNPVIRHIANLYEKVHLIDLHNLYYEEYTSGFLADGWVGGHYTPMTYNYHSSLIEEALNEYIYNNGDKFIAVPYG